MARKAKAKSRKSPKRSTRRSAPRRSRDVMDMVLPVLMAAGGYLAAELLIPKVLGGQSAKTRALVAGGAGIVLPMFVPSLAPIAVGIGTQGLVTLGRDVLRLNAPGAMRGLSDEDRKMLRRFADSGMVNGDGQFLNGPGSGVQSMLNGFAYAEPAGTDRNY